MLLNLFTKYLIKLVGIRFKLVFSDKNLFLDDIIHRNLI